MSENLKKLKVLDPTSPNKSTAIINGQASGILNWDDIKYASFNRTYKVLKANFWTPEEISVIDDKKSYETLDQSEKKAFNLIMGLLATLDAPQSRFLFNVAERITDPSAYANFIFVAQQEVIHNQSYSYILSTLLSGTEEAAIFDQARTNQVIQHRNENIMKEYDKFLQEPTAENLVRALVQSIILEGINFYSGFAFFYNLARQGKMNRTATIIEYINKDEIVHAKYVTEVLGAVLGENPHLNTPEFVQYVEESFRYAVTHEVKWSRSILADIDGIDMQEMEDYVKYRANKMISMLGLAELYPGHDQNSMKWIRAFEDNFDNNRTDFFEQRSRQYAKTGSDDGFDDL